MKIQAILFDLDDTLYDRGAAFRAWAEGFVQAHFPGTTAEERSEAIAQLVAVDAGGYGDRAELVARMLRLAPTLTKSPTDVLELFRVEFVRRMSLSPGVIALLDRLDANVVPYGIVTNGLTEPQSRKIRHLGLDRRTDCIFISESFGVKKPDARIFHAAAARLGVEPTNVLFVGDHPANDIVGAKRAEMLTAWLNRGYAWPNQYARDVPDYMLTPLEAIETVIFGK